MEVLVVESEPRAAASAALQLEAAGHQVLRCHEPDERVQGFPCVGLASGHCPLEEDDIDVVLTVRSGASPAPTALEDGVTCALRRRVPVVVAGRTAVNPFARWRVAVSDGDVVGACERAAAARLLEHEAVATKALDWTLRYRGLPTDTASAVVRRDGGCLLVTLQVPSEAPKLVRDMAVVRVAGALRAFDPHAAKIDIGCEMTTS